MNSDPSIKATTSKNKTPESKEGSSTPDNRRAKPRRRLKVTQIRVNTQTGVAYLVVTVKGKELTTIIDGMMVQPVARFAWTAQTNQRGEYAYFYTQIRMSDGIVRRLGLHRLVNMFKNGQLAPGLHLDHKDRDPLNNRESNLRPLPPQLNSFNSDRVTNGSSKFPGVSWHAVTKTWRAITTIKKKQKVLGRYDSEEVAAGVVLDKLMKLHPTADWEALSAEFFPGILPPA